MTELWNTLIVHPLINGLVTLYLPFRDFGFAIVFLTLTIRLATYPLFVVQIRSQRAMQEIAPAVAEIKKKYGKDRQRFAEEQMKLYRERGVNPMAGCLPLLVQFPILIGLYSALIQVGCGIGRMFAVPGEECPGLSRADLDTVLYPIIPNPIPPGAELDTAAHWLPWLVDGLARTDPWFILPVLAGATQFMASMMTLPAKAPPVQDPMQRSMQMMVYYFPIITVVIAMNLPSGLALYWVTTTVFQIVQQYLVVGWGKLAVYLPFLERFPSPVERRKRAEAAAIKEEVQARIEEEEEAPAGAAAPAGRGEGRRRRRRRRR